jgi:hypothetical protein
MYFHSFRQLCVLIGVLNPFVFQVIIDKDWFTFIILLFIFYTLYVFWRSFFALLSSLLCLGEFCKEMFKILFHLLLCL